MARHLVSVTDELLNDVLGVLGEIRDRLPAPKPEPTAGRAKVSEPAKDTAKPPTKRTRGGS